MLHLEYYQRKGIKLKSKYLSRNCLLEQNLKLSLGNCLLEQNLKLSLVASGVLHKDIKL